MQLPIKAHYAAVAMLALAESYSQGQLLTVRAIADQHAIPAQFLVQILQQLRTAGLITSTRGSSGGFRLGRAPSRISLAEIVEAVCPAPSTADHQSPSRFNAVVQEVWQELAAEQADRLAVLKLSDLGHRAEQPMFYI